MSTTADAPDLRCPCGIAAPDALPAPGRRPRPCPACGTPLVAPGRVPAAAIERGLGTGLLAAVAAAAGWAYVARETAAGAPWAIPVGAVIIALVVRTTAGARSTGLRWATVGAFAAFVAVGETLLYRYALEARLVAMHAAEKAASPEILAREERHATTFVGYLGQIETNLPWFLAVALGAAAVWWITRPCPAVVAFAAPCEAAAPEETAAADVPPDTPGPPAPATAE